MLVHIFISFQQTYVLKSWTGHKRKDILTQVNKSKIKTYIKRKVLYVVVKVMIFSLHV